MIDDSVEDFLAHYGVKGMRWGVRKDPETGSSRPSAKLLGLYKGIKLETPSDDERARNLAENEKKFRSKFTEDGSDPKASTGKRWRPTPKQWAYIGVGAAFVGLVAYSAYKGNKELKALATIPGEACDPKAYKFQVSMSKLKTWGGEPPYITNKSYLQDDFTLPKGHLFHRISTTAESKFKSATYATSNTDDFNRYLTAFRGEKIGQLHHVTFNAKEEVKVPSLVKRLEAMRSVLTDNLGYDSSLGYEAAPSDAFIEYTRRSGGSWSDITSGSFFNKLKAQGYGAIIDDMDAGVIGEAPLVLFNKDLFTEKVSKTISMVDISKAETSLVELLNRKP